jgi:hypothetical protein
MKLHSFFASEKNNPSRLSDSKSCESEGIYTNKIVHSLQYHHIIVKLNKQILYMFYHDIIDQLQQKYITLGKAIKYFNSLARKLTRC